MLKNCYISYLNLDHRADRREHIEAELKKVGLEAERTRGKLPYEFDLSDPKLQVMKNRTPGAIGCHYGQVEIMEKALAQNKHAFVIEDDVVFCSDLQERFVIIEDFLKDKDWSIFWLGGTYHYPDAWWHKFGHSPDLQQCGCNKGVDAEETDNPLFRKTYGAFSTHCYVVNYKFIDTLLLYLEENVHMSMGIDWLMILLQPHINSFAMNPGCAIQLDNMSDIGNGMTLFSGFKFLGKHFFSDKLVK
jgi:GR25 family glycosyltransferase involved in LPS biosynthesis